MKRSLILFAASLVVGGMAGATPLGFFAVSPQGTFLLQSGGDVCGSYNIPGCNMSAAFINLTALGVHAGDTLTITDVGGLCVYAAAGCTTYPASSMNMGAAFSGTNTLLGPSNQNRLPDGILPGAGATLIGTNPNLNANGNLDTTMPYDFYISATVVVPNGANFLVVGVLDSAYADNSSNLLGVNLDVTPGVSAVPEPGTYALLIGGIGALCMLRRKSA